MRPYLEEIMNNLKKFGSWKIQLTIGNNFISSIDNDEECIMHSQSGIIEVMVNDEADEVIKELFGSLKNRYQNSLESMKGSEFVFNFFQLLYYKCHNISANRGGSYIDSPNWIKNKTATINPIIKKESKCFEYTVTVALNYEEIKVDLQRITKIKPFLNKFTGKEQIFHQKKMIAKILRKIM